MKRTEIRLPDDLYEELMNRVVRSKLGKGTLGSQSLNSMMVLLLYQATGLQPKPDQIEEPRP